MDKYNLGLYTFFSFNVYSMNEVEKKVSNIAEKKVNINLEKKTSNIVKKKLNINLEKKVNNIIEHDFNINEINKETVPSNVTIVNDNSLNCRNISWLLSYFYNKKWCENLYNCLTYCSKNNLTYKNSYRYLLKLNEIKNKLINCSGNSEFFNENNNEYLYNRFYEDVDIKLYDSFEYNLFSYIFYILALKKKYSNDYSLLKDKMYYLFNKISLHFPDLVEMEEKDQKIYRDSYWNACFNPNMNNFEIIKNKYFEKYLTKDFFKNRDDFYENLIEEKLEKCISKDNKIFLPNINCSNKINQCIYLYDSYNVHIFINLILFSIDKQFAFKTFYEDFEMFENDDLIFTEYPLIINKSYNLFAVFNYFHEGAPQHFSLLTVKNNKLVENFSNSNRYIKNMLYNYTSTAIGAYIYEKTENITSLELYSSYKIFSNIKKIENYKKNMIEYYYYMVESLHEIYKRIDHNNFLIKIFENDSYKNIYIEENKKLRNHIDDYLNKINKLQNYIINDLNNDCKNILSNYLKIKIDYFQDNFKKFNYDKKHIFLFLNSVFFHKIFDENIQKADIKYINYIYNNLFDNVKKI